MSPAKPVVCVGINHELAAVEQRERLAVPKSHLNETLDELVSIETIDGAVLLSTCNRVEIYAESESETVVSYLEDRFSGGSGSAQNQADPDLPLYRHGGLDAAKHLFRVAAGLDSMVLGETEIFGQLKKAYAHAQERGTTTGLLNRLFQTAFRVGKRVRSQTEIQRGSTSIGSVGVDLAEKIFGSLSESQIMILGAGEMSRVTAQSMASRGAKGIIVANRSVEKAQQLASSMHGSALAFDDWPRQLKHIDILISSTSADGYVVTPEQIEGVFEERRGKPLFLIDIAVPRDIDPAIHEMDNVYVYDIDTIQNIASQARQKREKQIEICELMISDEAEGFHNQHGS